MLNWSVTVPSCQNHTGHTNTLWQQDVVFTFKRDNTYASNYYAYHAINTNKHSYECEPASVLMQTPEIWRGNRSSNVHCTFVK